MQDSSRPAALHAALRFVITNSNLSEHKATLIDVLLQALRDDEAAELHRQAIAVAQNSREWQEDEIALLKSFLKDRVARNWQDADESVMHLAMQLHRDPRSVRDMATELGFGISVDYGLSKALKRARGE